VGSFRQNKLTFCFISKHQQLWKFINKLEKQKRIADELIAVLNEEYHLQ